MSLGLPRLSLSSLNFPPRSRFAPTRQTAASRCVSLRGSFLALALAQLLVAGTALAQGAPVAPAPVKEPAAAPQGTPPQSATPAPQTTPAPSVPPAPAAQAATAPASSAPAPSPLVAAETNGTPARTSGLDTIAAAQQRSSVVAPPPPVKLDPPVTMRTGPGISAFIGGTTGIGIGYRQHFGHFGLQIGAAPFVGSDYAFISAGTQFMWTFFRRNNARIYALAGMGLFYEWDEFVGPDDRDLTLAPGAGVGLALNTRGGFFMALDLALTAYLKFEEGDFQSEDFRLYPTPNFAIGYYFN